MKSLILCLSCLLISCERPALKAILDDDVKEGSSEDSSDQIVQKTASLESADVDCGNERIGDKEVVLLEISNEGGVEAKQMVFESLPEGYSYSGGVFPGNNGTCSTTLAEESSCFVEIEFVPSSEKDYSFTWDIAYEDDVSQKNLEVAVSGNGVGYGDLDSSYQTNGYNIQDYGANEYFIDFFENVDNSITFIGSGGDGALGDANINVLKAGLDGVLDSTFGDSGLKTIDLDSNEDDLVVGAVQTVSNDIKILLEHNNVGGSCALDNAGEVLNSYGVLGSGLATLTSILGTSIESYKDVGLMQDGSLVLVGESTPLSGDSEMVISKIDDDGILDVAVPFFGGMLNAGNKLINSSIGGRDFGNTVDFNSDGNIFAGGATTVTGSLNSLLVLIDKTTGANVTSFGGGDGVFENDICGEGLDDEILDVKVLVDGKILIVGLCVDLSLGKDGYIARLNADGTLDTTFGSLSTGVVRLDIDGLDDLFVNVLVQPDGKIVAIGESAGSLNVRTLIVRLSANGVLDTTFGQSGIRLHDFGRDIKVKKAKLLTSGKLLIVGRAIGASEDFFSARLNM